jgi:hypothetical protein
VAPEFPPATPYGSTMFRNDDPRSHYLPRRALPIDTTYPAEVLLQRIWLREGEYGPYSAELVPELRDLGAALFADEQYGDAIDAYRRAIHLLRVNDGLLAFSQTEMIEQVIEAHIEVGNYIAADDQQDYLFRVRKASLSIDDPGMLDAVEQYADWHRAAYLGQLDRFRFPRIVRLADLYGDTLDELAEQVGENSRALLPYLEGKLKTEYMMSIYPGESEENLQVEASQRDDVELPDLTRLRFYALRDRNFRYGQLSIQHMRRILESDPATTPVELADNQVALGDWLQWHRQHARAIRAYREAWEMMADQPDGNDWLQATFGRPIELPLQRIFQPGRMPLRTLYAAEVRVRFGVSRHGEATDIMILAPSRDDNQPAVTRGYKYLRDMRFRPRLEGGLVVAADGLERVYNIRY